MAANATVDRPAKVPTPKQPPENSIWIRYHPWIEGVMAHISAWSIHLLVIGGAVIWFTYLAYALGLAHAPRSLPMEAVRLDVGGGGGNKEGTGTEKGGQHAPLKEGAASNKDNTGEKIKPIDQNDRPNLTKVQPKKIDEDITPGARVIKQDAASMQAFNDLNKDLTEKLRDGINPSKGNGGTGTEGGTGTGTGAGTGPGVGPGTARKLNDREKRFLRWDIILKTNDAPDMLRKLEVLGIVLGVPNGRDSIAMIDLSKRPLQPEIKDPSKVGKVYWIIAKGQGDIQPQELMQAMGMPAAPNVVILAFLPIELEEECAKKELAYRHVQEKDILKTEIEIYVPGLDGRKYSLEVRDQKRK